MLIKAGLEEPIRWLLRPNLTRTKRLVELIKEKGNEALTKEKYEEYIATIDKAHNCYMCHLYVSILVKPLEQDYKRYKIKRRSKIYRGNLVLNQDYRPITSICDRCFSHIKDAAQLSAWRCAHCSERHNVYVATTKNQEGVHDIHKSR